MRLGFGLTGPPSGNQRLHQSHGALPGLWFGRPEIGDHPRGVVRPRHRDLALLAQQAQAWPIWPLGQKRLIIAQPRAFIARAQAVPFHHIGRDAAHTRDGCLRARPILGLRQA